jgi:hypothetical protein
MDCLRACGASPRPNPEACVMLDLVYVAVGVLLIALMGVYADACRRL